MQPCSWAAGVPTSRLYARGGTPGRRQRSPVLPATDEQPHGRCAAIPRPRLPAEHPIMPAAGCCAASLNSAVLPCRRMPAPQVPRDRQGGLCGPERHPLPRGGAVREGQLRGCVPAHTAAVAALLRGRMLGFGPSTALVQRARAQLMCSLLVLEGGAATAAAAIVAAKRRQARLAAPVAAAPPTSRRVRGGCADDACADASQPSTCPTCPPYSRRRVHQQLRPDRGGGGQVKRQV